MINKGMKNLLFLSCFLIIVVVVTLVLSTFYKRKEFTKAIYFEISKVEVSPALRCSFYNEKGEELVLNSYTFFEFHGIKSGDIIEKKSNSREIKIYRKDSLGKMEIFLTLQPD